MGEGIASPGRGGWHGERVKRAWSRVALSRIVTAEVVVGSSLKGSRPFFSSPLVLSSGQS